MSESLTAEEIGKAFEDSARLIRKPPTVTIESIEPLAQGEGFKLRLSDFYGPLPDIEISTQAERDNILKAVDNIVTSTYSLARVRNEIQECVQRCSFLVPVLGDGNSKIAGIAGGHSGQGPVVAVGNDYLAAYISLDVKLRKAAGAYEASARMRQTLSGLDSVYLATQGLIGQGDEGAAIFYIAANELEKAGIKVIKNEEELCKRALPILAIRVNLLHEPEGFAAVSAGLELWQGVSLIRSPEIKAAAITWLSPVTIEVIKRDTVNGAILDILLKQIECFVDAYKYANGLA